MGDDHLVPVDGAHRGITCLNAYRAAGWDGTTDTTWLRRRALERLLTLADALPEPWGLAVFDGWRSDETVRALWRHYYGPGSTLEAGFLADPDDDRIDPPHATGGAVDLTFTWDRAPLSLGTHFDDFTHAAAADADVREPDATLRRLLRRSMARAGFVSSTTEWWHFSHGDRAWADETHGVVRYRRTAPSDAPPPPLSSTGR